MAMPTRTAVCAVLLCVSGSAAADREHCTGMLDDCATPPLTPPHPPATPPLPLAPPSPASPPMASWQRMLPLELVLLGIALCGISCWLGLRDAWRTAKPLDENTPLSDKFFSVYIEGQPQKS